MEQATDYIADSTEHDTMRAHIRRFPQTVRHFSSFMFSRLSFRGPEPANFMRCQRQVCVERCKDHMVQQCHFEKRQLDEIDRFVKVSWNACALNIEALFYLLRPAVEQPTHAQHQVHSVLQQDS